MQERGGAAQPLPALRRRVNVQRAVGTTRRSGVVVLGVVSMLALGGCILLVSEPSFGTQCRFAGAESACGACVATRCQGSVDACCRDDACTATLSALESCASKNDPSCNALAAAASATQPTSADLGKCIARRCAGECQPLEGHSATTCKELVLAPGASCSCVTSAEHNDFTCSGAVFPGARCCAPKGWPSAGLECSCKRAQCNPTADGCFCSLVDYTPDQEACGGTPGLFCCASTKNAECTCRSRPCYPDEQAVPSCSAGVLGCGLQAPVESCALRTP